MIIPRLKGGLGNQMFAIAAAASKAIDINTDYGINYTCFPHVGGQGTAPIVYKNSFYKKIPETDIIPQTVYNEPDWAYSPIPDNKDMVIDGYFQSKKHFSNNQDAIKNLFIFPEEITNKVDTALNKIKQKKLAIHVRLGDYLLPGYITTHFICDRTYFLKALREYNLNEYTVIVVTDNLRDYSKYIALDNVVIGNGKSELQDLYLLSQCDDIILSNSSFSWWGQFLGKKKNKVCAPSRWFGSDGPKNFEDIYEDSWIKIP